MGRQFFYCLVLATFLFATEGRAQQLPKSVAIGSNPPGLTLLRIGERPG